MKIKLLAIVLLAILAPYPTHAGLWGDNKNDISGFNGVEWGAVPSSVKFDRELKSKEGSEITIREKSSYTGSPKILSSKFYSIQYKFCEGYGLCAGVLAIDTTVGISDFNNDSIYREAIAILAGKYGEWGNPARVTTGQWKTPGGNALIEKAINRNRPYVLIRYRSLQYYKTINKIEARKGKNGAKFSGGFKF